MQGLERVHRLSSSFWKDLVLTLTQIRVVNLHDRLSTTRFGSGEASKTIKKTRKHRKIGKEKRQKKSWQKMPLANKFKQKKLLANSVLAKRKLANSVLAKKSLANCDLAKKILAKNVTGK